MTRRSWNRNTNAADVSERVLRSRDVPISNVDRKSECLERSSSKFFISFQTIVGLHWKGQYYLPRSLHNLLLTSVLLGFIYDYVYYYYYYYYY